MQFTPRYQYFAPAARKAAGRGVYIPFIAAAPVAGRCGVYMRGVANRRPCCVSRYRFCFAPAAVAVAGRSVARSGVRGVLSPLFSRFAPFFWGVAAYFAAPAAVAVLRDGNRPRTGGAGRWRCPVAVAVLRRSGRSRRRSATFCGNYGGGFAVAPVAREWSRDAFTVCIAPPTAAGRLYATAATSPVGAAAVTFGTKC